ncbi:MAG: hypothetical protein RDV48_01245 [Candidatus Eremiobacteraeota bacterium]|nr:hypothetical protein [Candidatus Eremiobacteraeota bacterium]
MIKEQMDYVNRMTNLMEETYRSSITSTTKFQENFVQMLKTLTESSLKTSSTVQEQFQEMTRKHIDATMDAFKSLAAIHSESTQKGIDAIRALMDRYGVENGEFRRSLEAQWKEQLETIQDTFSKTSETLRKEQEKQAQGLTRLYKDAVDQAMKDFEKKLEEAEKDRKSPTSKN